MSELRGKRAVVLGLGRQGMSTARYLVKQGADVVVSDIQSEEALAREKENLADLPITFVLGEHPPSLLEGAGLLCLSGGVPADLPLAQQARRRGIPVTNDSQLFLEHCPAKTVGITGSAGKTTTATLVGRIAAASFKMDQKRAWVGGNIGRPLLDDLPNIDKGDLVIMELSSFQLELMSLAPNVAAVLNLTPNHLDRHKTMQAYQAAKVRILSHQSPEDLAVLGRDDPGAWGLQDKVQGRLMTFGWEPQTKGEGVFIAEEQFWLRYGADVLPVGTISSVKLRGRHNLMNVAAAYTIAAAADLPVEAMEAAVRDFEGVPHRLEFVRRVGGVEWYNDSIASSPERAIAAIRSFEGPLVLLAGGRDKDLPWASFAAEVRQRVDHLILFGEASATIARALHSIPEEGSPLSIETVPGLDEAVAAAAQKSHPGSIVLLAPGATSFDAFTDFSARGERFKELVNSL